MKPPTLLLAGLVLGLVGPTPAQDAPTDDPVRRARAALATPIDPKDLPDDLTLGMLLPLLEGKLPAGKKVPLFLDENGLGDDLKRVAWAKVPGLPAGERPLGEILERALAGSPVEVDFAILPPGVVVTTPKRAAHPLSYDVRHLLRHAPRLLTILRQQEPETYRDLRPGDGVAILVRAVLDTVSPRPWESVEVHNAARLVVTATGRKHAEVATLLGVLERHLDVAVVMNARLYEVDRAFFTKRLAPLFAPDKATGQRPAVVALDDATFRAVAKETLVGEGDDRKLTPDRSSPFLSRQAAYRHAAGVGLAGVTFAVTPEVSADRRFLKLAVTQSATHLVRIDKVATRDPVTDKATTVEVPNLHKTTAAGTVDLPDAGALLMPIDAVPAGDKVRVLVARPFIWIEAEERERRNDGGAATTPQAIWDSPVPSGE